MVENTQSRSGRRWLLIPTFIIAALLLLCAMLPSLLSSQWGKARVMGLAAPQIPGELQLETWSLSWLGEQQLSGISYIDQQSGMQMNAKQLTLSKGLASFLLDRGNVGTVTLSQPAIQLTLPEPVDKERQQNQTPDGEEPAADAASPEPAPPSEAAPASLAIPPLSGTLVVEQGSLAIAPAGGTPEPVATDIAMNIDLASLEDPLSYTLALASADGAGSVAGQGRVIFDTANDGRLIVQPTGNVEITNWNISQLLELAAIYGDIPTGEGSLSSSLNFAGDSKEAITIDGTLSLTNLLLAGGPLKDDQPSIDNVSFEFSGVSKPESVELSSLTLSSPLASGILAGTIGTDNAVQFNSDLQIDLPEVSRQFPHTLSLQEDLQITGGILALKAVATLDQGASTFTTNAVVEGLAGIRGGKQISLAEPFTFNLTGKQDTETLRLEQFTLTSSFVNGQGSGDLNDLQINLKADLKAALNEISQFISLQDYQAAGNLELNIEAIRKDETSVTLAARLGAEKLVVKQGKTLLIPENPLSVRVDSSLNLSPAFSFSGLSDLNLSYQAWLGNGSLTGKEIVMDANGKVKKVGALVAEGELSLNDLAVMLHRIETLPPTFAADGNSRYSLKISGTEGRFLLDEFALESPKLSVQEDNIKLIPPSALRLTGTAELLVGADGTINSIEKPILNYDSWFGNGKLQADRFTLPATELKGLAFTGNTDLGKLTTLLNGLKILPPEISLQGANVTSMRMDYSPALIKTTSLVSETDNFVLKQQEKTYKDKRLVIDTAGTLDTSKRQAALSPLHLDSANGSISFEQVSVGDWNNPADTLDSSGQARFDLATVLSAATDWIPLPPDISAAGTVDLNWNATSQSNTAHRYELNADLSEVNLVKSDITALSDERVVFRMNSTRNPTSGLLALDQVSLTSQPVTLDASGHWQTGNNTQTDIDLTGDLAMDLARIAELVRTFTELDLEMAGKSERPFELAIKANEAQREKWWQQTRFNTVFQAEIIKVLGVELRSLEIPINVAEGLGEAKISGTANQGQLLLQPRLDLMSTPPVLTIPDNSRVLDKMQISREMANKLLARIHPLFMGATQMSGVFDLDLHNFNWPLGKENLNDLQFAGTMDFHDVRLDSSALIGTLLTVMRVEETGMDLSGRQIQFVCKDGRVETNPLRTNLSDSELVISGSLGLDTTIDYLAQVEVTERLVGGDLYNHLEGTMIRVPIGGTLSKPDVSATTVQKAVGDLVNQAGRKKLEEAAGNLLKKLF